MRSKEGNRILWEFKGYYDEGCIAVLLYSGEFQQGMIAIVSNGAIVEVIPLSEIADVESVSIGGKLRWRAQIDPEKAIRIKESLARENGYGVVLSVHEKAIRERIDKAADLSMQRRLADQRRIGSNERLRREEARKKLIGEIEARGMVQCWAADGRKLSGYPVGDDEWPSLQIGTPCVTGASEGMTHFYVQKDQGGCCSKESAQRVFPRSPLDYAKADIPEVSRELLFCVGSRFVTAFEVDSDAFNGIVGRMRDGSCLAVRNPGSARDYSVYRVSDGKPFEVDDHLEPEA